MPRPLSLIDEGSDAADRADLPIGGSPSMRHMMWAWRRSPTIPNLVGLAVQEEFPGRSTPQRTSSSLPQKNFVSLPTATASRLWSTTAESGLPYPAAMLRCWVTSNVASRSHQSIPAHICRSGRSLSQLRGKVAPCREANRWAKSGTRSAVRGVQRVVSCCDHNFT